MNIRNKQMSAVALNMSGIRPAALRNLPTNLVESFTPRTKEDELSKYLTQNQIKRVKSITRSMVEDEIALAEKKAITMTTIFDDSYPERLRHLTDPPPIIYLKGRPLTNQPKLGVVGSRATTPYGKGVTKYFVESLAGTEIETVSGVALGVDSFAHRFSIMSRVGTIGVLGTGIDKVYPKANFELHRRIEEQGTLLSEFPINTPATKYNFPRRNRLIAALSYGVLVVEAALRSGSLITANFAIDLGREVFAVPGDIFSKNSQGTNILISLGAKPAIEAKEILPNFKTNKYICDASIAPKLNSPT